MMDFTKEPGTVIITHYRTGGSFQYLQQLVTAFQGIGYSVSFCLPENTDLEVRGTVVYRCYLKDPSLCPSFLRVRILKYLCHLSKYFYNALNIDPGHHIRIAHLLFPFHLTDWLTVDRLKRKGIKVILTVHNVMPHKLFLPGDLDKKLSARIYRKADLLLVHTDSLKENLTHIYLVDPQKIHVVPHGFFDILESPVDAGTLKAKYSIPPDKKVLLFFGYIRGNKGLDILLHAVRELPSDYFLLIAGDSEGASEIPAGHYEKIIAGHNLRNSVRWIKKYISHRESSEVFKIADAVVLPYKKSFYAQSGVLNLAIGHEKPSVVSNVGGIGETVKKYNLGVVVKPEDAGSLKYGILSLFEGLAGGISFNFAKYKRENNWAYAAEKLALLYDELARKESP